MSTQKNTPSGVILSSKPALAKNGQPYSVVTVSDMETKTTLYIWNSDSKEFKPGCLLAYSAKESNGMLSCSKADTKLLELSTNSPLYLYYKSLSPVPTKEEWSNLATELSNLIDMQSPLEERDPLADLFLSIMNKLYIPYSQHTAARAHHHAYIGGLAEHTYELLNMFLHLYPSLPYKVNTFIVSIACLFHDYGKLSEYTQDFEYQDSFFLQGHPFLSAEALGNFLRTQKLSEHLIKHCQHAVLSHHQRLEWGSPVLPCTPEAYLVSMLDALSGTGIQYNQPVGTQACSTTIQRF